MPDSQSPLFSPRGIRNANPGNIRGSDKFVWRGQVGVDSDGFARFASPLYGIRAICLVWQAYHEHHGCTTLRQYITRWAPPSENDTAAYVAYMEQQLGVYPDVPLDIHADAANIVAAIIRYENAEQPYTLSTIQRGITLSHER